MVYLPEILNPTVIPVTKHDIHPDLAHGRTQKSWHNPVEGGMAWLQHVLLDAQLVHGVSVKWFASLSG
jgi:hypothetical protein